MTNHERLNELLADYIVLYQKLRGYHWNVKGPLFFTLHQKFEEMYDEASLRVDGLAEQVAASGARPVSTLRQALELAKIQESADISDGMEMVRDLVTDMTGLNGRLRTTAAEHSERGDTATANLLEAYADEQDKTLWMLRAFSAS